MSHVGNRTMQRVTVGDIGYLDMFPQGDIGDQTGKLEPKFEREKLQQPS